LISFLRAQLPICHRPQVVHLLLESKKPNKAPEPTPCAGTSAAQQPRVPAPVVAHL
jgi:hypothetical protein